VFLLADEHSAAQIHFGLLANSLVQPGPILGHVAGFHHIWFNFLQEGAGNEDRFAILLHCLSWREKYLEVRFSEKEVFIGCRVLETKYMDTIDLLWLIFMGIESHEF
jgi:hypothetical protein